jgi:histone-binding protein RBBP4
MGGNTFGSVSDDMTFAFVDLRQPDHAPPAKIAKDGHRDAINALAFHPLHQMLVATASGDHTIGIWDLRNLKDKIHTLEGHQDSVTVLAWNPNQNYILGSGGYDRRILFWNLSKIGDEQSPEDAEEGPPEL